MSFLFYQLCFLVYSICALHCVSSASIVDDHDAQFLQFKRDFNKKYSNDEEEFEAKRHFIKNLLMINDRQGKHGSAVFKVTEISDQPPATDSCTLLQQQTEEVTCSAVGVPKTSSILFSPLPPRKDYTFFASEVKNQRSCGACWIFTSVAAVEVLLKRKKYFGLARKDTVDISLSEQELLDCILQVDYCKGGDLETAIEFMNKTGVIDEQLYPYRKDNNASLPRPMCLAPYRLTSRIVLGYENCYLPKTSAMTPGSEVETLLMKMAFMGPVAVGFSVPAELMARIGISNVYKVTEETCLNVTSAGHGMLLVGYGGGPDDKQDPLSEPYWIFKNSWGTAWGEFGYIRIARNMACNIFIQFLRPDILRDI